MFKTKICGVTTVASAIATADSGVDAIGLNFYERSQRFVSDDDARDIIRELPRGVKRVGVFVNASIDRIRDLTATLQLDLVQLHGDESPEFVSTLELPGIIRAFRTQGNLSTVRQYLDQCERWPDAVLLDAYDPAEYGGTGKTLNWDDLGKREDWLDRAPLILAGGLKPENVAEAIRLARPFAVDTASGVEAGQPGHKDPARCQRFVDLANLAFSVH